MTKIVLTFDDGSEKIIDEDENKELFYRMMKSTIEHIRGEIIICECCDSEYIKMLGENHYMCKDCGYDWIASKVMGDVLGVEKVE